MKDSMTYICKHYSTMISNDQCKAGVQYSFPPLKPLDYPCFGKNIDQCEKRESFSAAEIKAEKKRTSELLRLINEGISPCCNAPIDESQVIVQGGPLDGQGPRFCSKCKKVVYVV